MAAAGKVRLPRTLKAKFAVLVALLLAAVFSLTGLGMVRYNSDEVLALVEQRGRMLTAMQSESLIAPLWSVDLSQIQAILTALRRDPDFRGARVVDAGGKAVAAIGRVDGDGQLLFSEPIAKDGETLGKLELVLSRAAIDDYRTKNLITTAGVLGGILATILACFWVLLGFIFRPLKKLVHAMGELAIGNFDVVLPGLGRHDELGDIAGAVEAFKEKAAEKARQETEQKIESDHREIEARRAAEQRESAQRKAVEEQAAADRRMAMRKLADDFETVVGKVIDGVSAAAADLENAAHRLTETADKTLQLSTAVASVSESASSNVGSVASSTEELNASVREISRQVHESSKIADEAVAQAERTDGRISALSQAAGRIGDVVKLITAIAEQTNLLALNATIEAARAGEAGKGFAVVAQEVKALAAQTSRATDEIGSQITGMQAATNESVQAIKEIGETIAHISKIAGSIASAVEQQGSATREIAGNIQQASAGTTEVATNINDVKEGASKTGTASVKVLTAAKSLSQESETLKSEVSRFLDTVRAA